MWIFFVSFLLLKNTFNLHLCTFCELFLLDFIIFSCQYRVKLTLEGLEEDDDDDDKASPTVLHKMSNSLEISLISDNEFKCRHSQPECGYGLQPDRWTEYSIQTMEPDNLELIFDFFEVSSDHSKGSDKEFRLYSYLLFCIWLDFRTV